MPGGRPSYVILGLTDGAGHTVNPCLASQLDWARSGGVRTGAYLVASYPSKLQRNLAANGLYGECGASKLCRLHNDGAAQAASAVATMRAVGLVSPRIWIDVEFRHFYPWTRSNWANAAVIQGIVRGLKAARVPMGVYTTSYMWRAIVGNYQLDVPNWLPSGDGRPKHAMAMCSLTATGGVTWLVQYTRSLDSDLTCPVLNPLPGHHGRLWKWRRTTQKLLSYGPAVRAVQRVVGQPVSGSYGPLTALAVSRWQAAHHVTRTGVVTPVDWRAMGAYRMHGGRAFGLTKIAGPS
jgi:peptidoglycan hydrolase-like protein with peptidoglycan-binding domain